MSKIGNEHNLHTMYKKPRTPKSLPAPMLFWGNYRLLTFINKMQINSMTLLNPLEISDASIFLSNYGLNVL